MRNIGEGLTEPGHGAKRAQRDVALGEALADEIAVVVWSLHELFVAESLPVQAIDEHRLARGTRKGEIDELLDGIKSAEQECERGFVGALAELTKWKNSRA